MLVYTLLAALRDLDQEDLVGFEFSSLISALSENDDTLWYLSSPTLVFRCWERIGFLWEAPLGDRGTVRQSSDCRLASAK
jgi:hypothetical protein